MCDAFLSKIKKYIFCLYPQRQNCYEYEIIFNKDLKNI